MAFPRTLAEFRAEILRDLGESIRSLVDSLEASRAHTSYGLDDFETVAWVVRLIRKSLSDLQYLFDLTDPVPMADMPACLDVVAYQFNVDSAGTCM